MVYARCCEIDVLLSCNTLQLGVAMERCSSYICEELQATFGMHFPWTEREVYIGKSPICDKISEHSPLVTAEDTHAHNCFKAVGQQHCHDNKNDNKDRCIHLCWCIHPTLAWTGTRQLQPGIWSIKSPWRVDRPSGFTGVSLGNITELRWLGYQPLESHHLPNLNMSTLALGKTVPSQWTSQSRT